MSIVTCDVAIVGAGIVGAACADECARRGLQVILLDQDAVGAGATAAGMGHIVVMDDSQAQFALTRYSQRLWQDLRRELPDDVEYEQCGTIWVAADDEEMQEVQRKRGFYGDRGVPTHIIDARGLGDIEPNLRDGMKGGLLVVEDGVLYPPCAARFLAERAQQRGATLRLGCSVRHIEGGQVALADGSTIRAQFVVNAMGASAPDLTRVLRSRSARDSWSSPIVIRDSSVTRWWNSVT